MTLNVGVPPELLKRLDAACDERVLGRKVLVRIAIERLLDDLPPIPFGDHDTSGGTHETSRPRL